MRPLAAAGGPLATFALPVLLALAAPSTARAQVSRFNFNFHAGYGVTSLQSTALVRDDDPGSPTYNTYVRQTTATNATLVVGGAGFDAPLVQWGQGEQALGVSLNAQLGLMGGQQADDLELFILGDFPQYLTYRYGAKASRHAKSAFGVGVGGGYRFSLSAAPYHAPSALLEVTYATAHNDWFLRFTADLQPTRAPNLTIPKGPVEDYSARELCVVLGYSL